MKKPIVKKVPKKLAKTALPQQYKVKSHIWTFDYKEPTPQEKKAKELEESKNNLRHLRELAMYMDAHVKEKYSERGLNHKHITSLWDVISKMEKEIQK